MVGITDRMKAAANEFESAAIDAGFDFAKVEMESGEWSLVRKHELRIFGVDVNDKSHRWTTGGEYGRE